MQDRVSGDPRIWMPVFQLLMDKRRETGSLDYRVIPSEAIGDKTIDEINDVRFAVGVGDQLTEMSFTDLRLLFSAIDSALEQIKEHAGESEFKVSINLKPTFTEEESRGILSRIKLEDP